MRLENLGEEEAWNASLPPKAGWGKGSQERILWAPRRTAHGDTVAESMVMGAPCTKIGVEFFSSKLEKMPHSPLRIHPFLSATCDVFSPIWESIITSRRAPSARLGLKVCTFSTHRHRRLS